MSSFLNYLAFAFIIYNVFPEYVQSFLARVSLSLLRRQCGLSKEDIDIEQQLYEIVRGKNFALNCLS